MISMQVDFSTYITIALCALGTYILRIGGLLLAEKIPTTERFTQFMDALPGTILLSLVVPGIVNAGIAGIIACSATILCVYKTRSVLLSMFVGMGVIIITRHL
jgi:uncharacterized membrane protein